MKKNMKVLSLGVGLFILGFCGLVLFLGYTFVNSPASPSKQDIVYEIALASSFATIAQDLQNKGVVKNAAVFSLFAKFTGARGKVKHGEYALHTQMRPSEVLSVITSGRSIARPFTVSEGLNIYEIAELYAQRGFGSKEEFFKLATDPALIQILLGQKYSSLEGYLFPETYQITKYTTARELIIGMVKRHQSVFADITTKYSLNGLTARQLLILASIVEKESGSSQERPLIAGVFHNRLKKGMKLQTDPTILYGKAVQSGKLSMSITREDLISDKNPYNTYVIPSLPPGPISNPGREALIASLQPPPTKFFFFVSQNNGTSIFSETYEEHHKAVQKYQLDSKARSGKSWRDLKKNNE